MFKIITEKNFNEIETYIADARQRAINNKEYQQAGFWLCAMGERTIERLSNTFGVRESAMPQPYKTDGKTTAKNVSCLIAQYYFDARDMMGYFTNEFAEILVEFNDTLLRVSDCNEKTHTFVLFNDDLDDYKHYLPYGWKDENPEPNRVGTLSDKKMQQWVNYLTKRRDVKNEEKRKAEGEVAAFESRIQDELAKGCDESNVRKTEGYIVRNGLKLSWTIVNNHVTQRLEVHYATGWRDKKDALSCFGEMCEEKYKLTK